MALSGSQAAQVFREIERNTADVAQRARDLQASAQRARIKAERTRIQTRRLASARTVQRDQRASGSGS